MFKKLTSPSGVKSMFKKGLSTVSSASKTFGNVANVASKGIDTASKILNDPTVQKIAGSTAQGQKALETANKAIGLARGGLQKAKTIQSTVDTNVAKFSN